MTNEEKVKEFDEFFSKQYTKIKSSAISILKYRDDTDDIIHEVYLTVRDRIMRKNYEGSNYHGYLYRSFQNELRLAKNREKKVKHVDIEDEHVSYVADWFLIDMQESNDDTLIYRQDIEYMTKRLFTYISTRFNEKEQYLFRTYYLSKNKMTYMDLAAQTKYEYNTCSSIIKDMKKVIRLEFLQWMYDNS